MYAYLEGKFTYKSPAQVYIEVNGVGYEVNITLNTYTYIQDKERGKLYTWLQVKEDAHILYGFFEKEEKEMFLLLTSVSGIGAATARMMLSGMQTGELATCIAQSNVKVLEGIKGIGKKTAERLVLELKDKVGKVAVTGSQPHLQGNKMENDALNALTALGISRQAAEQALKKVINEQPVTIQLEDLIKKALKAI